MELDLQKMIEPYKSMIEFIQIDPKWEAYIREFIRNSTTKIQGYDTEQLAERALFFTERKAFITDILYQINEVQRRLVHLRVYLEHILMEHSVLSEYTKTDRTKIVRVALNDLYDKINYAENIEKLVSNTIYFCVDNINIFNSLLQKSK